MPKYHIETPRGKKLTIESDSPEEATRLADTWDLEDHASSEATRMGLNPDTALRQMRQESGSQSGRTSPKGARGPMQLMPDTARELGVDPDDPYANITGGLTYYKKQLDANGGDERRALAAYNAGPGAVARAGGVPNYPETVNYVNAIMGPDGAPVARPKPPPLPGQPGAVPVPQRAAVARAQAPLRADQGLGFMKGLTHVGDRAAQGLEYLAGKAGVADEINALNKSLGLPSTREAMDSRTQYLARQRAAGVRPGQIGEFAGNFAGTAALPGGPLVQGALGGALTGDATTAKGIAGEAALGGIVGRGAALASDALQLGARKVLSKAPQILTIEGLKKGYQDAYKAVDASGFKFPKGQVNKLVDDFEATMKGRALSKTARGEAGSVMDDIRAFVRDNGDVSISQMESFRRDIYDALVKKGGDTGAIGGNFRGQIDKLMDSVPNADLKRGRELYKRWTTADFVNRASKSADRAAEQTYGGDFGRKVKDRLAPLVDELKPTRNIRGASPDVIAGIEKVVRGSKTQNLASTLGGMTDVRRMGGKILQGTLGAMTGVGAAGTAGASLIPSLMIQGAVAGGGAGLTATASGIARKNVNDLIKLIAAGGSQQAVKRVPTKASQAVETAISRVARPALVASAVPALAAARRDPKRQQKK